MKGLLANIKDSFNVFYLVFYSVLVFFSSIATSASTDLSIAGILSSETIGNGNVSSLTLTLDNQTGQSVSDIGFLATIDDPTFMLFSDPVNVSTTCSNGDYTFTASDFTASDYKLISGQSCSFTFDVIGNVDDGLTVLDVTVSSLNSSAGVGTNPAGAIQLTVDPSYMTTSLAVAYSTLSVGSVNTAIVTVGNLPLLSGSFYYVPTGTISFPEGVSLASPINFSTTCGSMVTNSNTAGSTSFVLPFSAYADSTSCDLSFDIIANNAGSKELLSTELTDPKTNQQIGKISTSYISELSFINARFSPTALVPNGTATIDVSILNTDRSNPASNIAFTDDLDGVLSGLVSTEGLTDVCGSGSSLTGTGLLTFTGGSLAAGASCEFSINVAVPANATPGNYINTISAVSYELDGSTINPIDALSSFIVNSAPSLAISTNQSGNPTTSVAVGDVISVEYVLTNVDIANAASSVSFAHELTGLPYFTATVPADGFCNGSGTATFVPSFNPPPPSSYIDANTTFTGISLAAGDSCTFTLDYLVPDDFDAGSYLFSVGMIDATVNGNSVQSTSPSASSVFTVDAAPQLTMVFNEGAVAPGGSSTIEFAISHGAGSTYTAEAIGFSLDLDAVLTGMTIQSLPSEPCGIGSTISGSSSLALASGALAAGEVCEFSVPVTIPVNASAGTYTFNSSTLSASINGSTLSSGVAAADLQVTNVTFAKSFSPSSLRVGNVTTTIDVVYVINNADSVEQVTDITFNDDFSGIYSGVTVASATQADACGSGSSAMILSGTTLYLTGGIVDPLASCTFNVTLNLPANMPANSYASSSSSIDAKVNAIDTSFNPVYADFIVNEISVLTSIDVSSPTSASSTLMSINFSEAVQNFVVGDIAATNATLTNFVELATDQYTVEVTPNAEGIVTLNVAAGVAEDVLDATVTNTEAVTIIFEYQSVPLSPTPSLIIGEPSSLLTSNGDIIYSVSYTDVETVNLTADAITLNTTGDAGAVISVLNGDTSSATIVLSGFTGDGSIGINVAAETARYSTNLAPAAGPSSVFILDTQQPSVTITGPTETVVGSFTATFDFSENVSGFDVTDIQSVNAGLSGFTLINGQRYSVEVMPTAQVSVELSVNAGAGIDSAGNVNTASTIFVVNFDFNDTPIVSGTPTTSVFSGSSYSFTPIASDADSGDVLEFSITNKPLWADFDSVTGSLTGTPTVNDVGVTSGIVITVSDGTASASLSAFSIEVTQNNGPLAISGTPASSVLQNANYIFSPLVDSDANETLSFTVTNKPQWAMFDNVTGVLSGTPVNADVGTNSGIVITVMDGVSNSASLNEFSIEVINVNDAPVFTSTPLIEVVAEQAYSYQVTAEDIDVEHDISFTLITAPDWLNLSLNGLVTGTAPAEVIGEQFTVVIALTDGELLEPVLQQYSLAVIAPGDTTLSVDIYFTPAPIAPGDDVSLVIEIENSGLVSAKTVMFNLELSNSVALTELPAICTEIEVGLLDCQLDSDIAVGELSATIIGLRAADDTSGFAIAELQVTAENLNGESASATAQLLIAEVLSLVPGEVLSSTPVEHGVTIDINGDSFVDLVSFNSATEQLDIRLNDGLGSLIDSGSLDTIGDVNGIVAGDVNGDGFVDILTVGGANANNIAYLLDGDQLTLSHHVLDAVQADIILIVDLNNDGDVSVILAGIYQSDVAIYTGIGSGNESVELINFFELIAQNSSIKTADKASSSHLIEGVESASASPATSGVTDITLVETAERVQLIVSSDSESPVIVQSNEGEWQATEFAAFSGAVERLVIADMDSDSKLDGFSYQDGQWTLTIDLFGTPKTSMVSFPDADELLIEDVNRDGVMDILFVTPQGVSIWHYYGIDDIRVSAVIVGSNIVSISLLDIDNDGDLDLVTLDSQAGMSLWYLSLDNGFGEQEIELSLFAQAPNFPQLDQSGPVSFMLTNQGNSKATGVILSITADSGVTLSQLPTGCDMAGVDLVCTLGEFEIGMHREITVWATTSAVGTYQIKGEISAKQTDINAENDTVTVSLFIPEKAQKSSDAGALPFIITLWLIMFALYRRRKFS